MAQAIPVGHELDAAVAIQVLGHTDRIPGHLPPRGAGRVPGTKTYYTDACYSTHDETALKMLHAARGINHFDLGSLAEGGYYCQIQPFPGDEPIGYGQGATLAEAICRATLALPKHANVPAVRAAFEKANTFFAELDCGEDWRVTWMSPTMGATPDESTYDEDHEEFRLEALRVADFVSNQVPALRVTAEANDGQNWHVNVYLPERQA